MKRTIRKYIKRISLKNLILPGIILIIALVLARYVPFEQMLLPENVTSAAGIISEADGGSRFVSFEIDDLTYTGYDYYKNGKATASFYYTFTQGNENCVFFLIEDGASLNSGTAKIVTKREYVNTFLANYAKDLNLSTQALLELSGGYIISTYDYNIFYYMAMAVILALIVLLCVIYIIGNIIVFFAPSIHPSCRRLKKYGLSGKDFSEIDAELENDTIIEAGNMFATSHYLIVFGRGTINMVPLFNVIWAYSFVGRQLFVARRLLSYTFVVYTSPMSKIVMRGNRKKNVDKILKFLDRDFSHIEVGYTQETHKKIRRMIKNKEI